jgi:hypothetical protein
MLQVLLFLWARKNKGQMQKRILKFFLKKQKIMPNQILFWHKNMSERHHEKQCISILNFPLKKEKNFVGNAFLISPLETAQSE